MNAFIYGYAAIGVLVGIIAQFTIARKKPSRPLALFLICAIAWPLVVIFAWRQLFGLTKEPNYEYKPDPEVVKRWTDKLAAAKQASKSAALKITPRGREYICDSIDEILRDQADPFFYFNDIAKCMDEYWTSGVSAHDFVRTRQRGRREFMRHMRAQGGSVSFKRPDSSLHFTESFFESLREVRHPEERYEIIAAIQSLDRRPGKPVPQVSDGPFHPLGCADAGDYVLVIVDSDGPKRYLLCAAVKC